MPLPSFMQFWLPNLAFRYAGPESMDDFSGNPAVLEQTLDDFKTINIFLGCARHLLSKHLLPLLRKNRAQETSILDVGSGGGDIARWLAFECRREELPVRIICVDNDERAVAYASRMSRPFPSITNLQGDAFAVKELIGPVDYILANHFLHHIDESRIPALLKTFQQTARKGFLVSDLRRSVWAYIGFTLLAGILWRHGFTFADGRISIRRSFTVNELKNHAIRADLGKDARVFKFFPFHVCISYMNS